MFSLFVDAAWKVLVAGVVLGAGLPAVFALGVRSLAMGTTAGVAVGGQDAVPVGQTTAAGRVLAVICFGIVVIGIAIGLTYVIAAGQGKMLNFDHVYPTIVPKS